MNIPFINIADVNCWMIYLMPFSKDERTNYELVDSIQEKCIQNNLFGMGWDIPCFEYGTPISDENARIYAEKYKLQNNYSVSVDALGGYKSIKKGDYVIFRRKNGHYYVGRVSSNGTFYLFKDNVEPYKYFSWGGTVEKWVEYANDSELPSEIVGRFSQRLHSTILRISPYRQRMLVIAMYENKTGNNYYSIPKLRIDKTNFVRSLNYMQLEDLVALYITNKHASEGYRLIPSSCKISQQNYEFSFISRGRKPITCQVKNQQEVIIDHYIKEESYQVVYIFSGKWDVEKVKQLRTQYQNYAHIYIISPDELYETLEKENPFNNDFYDFDNQVIPPDMLDLDGYILKDKPNAENEYSKDDSFVCFVRKDGLFYSAEFNALVLSWHILDDKEYEKECAERIMEKLNTRNK